MQVIENCEAFLIMMNKNLQLRHKDNHNIRKSRLQTAVNTLTKNLSGVYRHSFTYLVVKGFRI